MWTAQTPTNAQSFSYYPSSTARCEGGRYCFLQAGFALLDGNGTKMSDVVNPAESGFAAVIKPEWPRFSGRSALIEKS
jgi:hypothetical protein